MSEVSELITEILDKAFLENFLNATGQAQIDSSKIVMTGHSYGGSTALKSGDVDQRIRIVMAHDPWTSILEPDYDTFDALLDKPMHLVTSS